MKNKFPLTAGLSLIILCAISFIFSFSLNAGDKERITAQPFDLSDVMLLDGPFKKAMELDAAYLLEIDPDRLLSRFRTEAGLEAKAESYGGWENMSIAGHSLGHYLSACAMMYASTGDNRFCERVDYIVNELEICQQAYGDGFVAAFPNGKEALSGLKEGIVVAKPFDLNGIWVPWYTLHKQFAGLLDANHYCHNAKALDIAIKLADWAVDVTSGLTEEQFQMMLACEHGGMNEVLAELYNRTNNSKYLDLSRRFHHKFVLDPLTNKVDKLNGLHANTQIPKIIGLARRYELAGNSDDKGAAEFFWNRVVHHHSYVIGGNSEEEHFGAPDSLDNRLNYNTCETCNTYNMLKLTKHLFSWNPTAEYGDYYERALYNHILASQQPDSGMFCYFVPLRPGSYKTYSDKFNSFWCCVGSGMENHSKYGESIYFRDDNNLWVNLYIASELEWKEKNIRVKQETNYPESGKIKFTIQSKNSTDLILNFRYPFWAEKGMQISVNGKAVIVDQEKESFVSVSRTWNDGDIIEVDIPFSLRTESMPDNKNHIAIFYGPILLAGDLGSQSDTISLGSIFVPYFVNGGKNIEEWIQQVDDQPITFKTSGTGRPYDVTLTPFYKMHNRRYSVYWNFITQIEWQEIKEKADKEAQYYSEIKKHAVDFIQPGDEFSEKAHNFKGENTEPGIGTEVTFRYASWGGWFSYDLTIAEKKDLKLHCIYWGGDGGKREFDILIDDEIIKTETLKKEKPGEYFSRVYDIPEKLIENKDKITLRFRAKEGNNSGGIFGISLLSGMKQ